MRGILKKYAKDLKGFKKKYFAMEDNKFKWLNITLELHQYDTKALEIILPDVMISERSVEILKTFQKEMAGTGIEVWYLIGE